MKKIADIAIDAAIEVFFGLVNGVMAMLFLLVWVPEATRAERWIAFAIVALLYRRGSRR